MAGIDMGPLARAWAVARIGEMALRPRMYAYHFEAYLLQIMMLLEVAGIEHETVTAAFGKSWEKAVLIEKVDDVNTAEVYAVARRLLG